MEKLAETAYPINTLLESRWSPRAFADRQVENEKLLSLFEAARWAPSAGNGQPWTFIVTTRGEGCFAALASTLGGLNQSWAPSAPVLVLAAAGPGFRAETVNRYSYYDLGQAVAHLSMQAGDLGLQVHQMAGFDPAKARELFDLPATLEPVTVFAIGYPGNPDELPQPLRERELAPRTRKPLGQVVFKDSLGNPFDVAVREQL
jgi:nitroreductase